VPLAMFSSEISDCIVSVVFVYFSLAAKSQNNKGLTLGDFLGYFVNRVKSRTRYFISFILIKYNIFVPFIYRVAHTRIYSLLQ
jgi:hypothetical protein